MSILIALAGVACLVAAGFLIAPVIGLAILGAALLAIAWGLDGLAKE